MIANDLAFSDVTRRFASALLLLSASSALAQYGGLEPVTARSTSGQFVVRGIPQGPPRARDGDAEVNYLRLDPMLTAVSLDRIRQLVQGELNLPEKWRGLITVNTLVPVICSASRGSAMCGRLSSVPKDAAKPTARANTTAAASIAQGGAPTFASSRARADSRSILAFF